MKKVHVPAGEPTGRIVCTGCGNKGEFVEVADGVLVTTRYIQNLDGSFTPEENETEVFGEVKFICGKCGKDLSQYHTHFLEMSF